MLRNVKYVKKRRYISALSEPLQFLRRWHFKFVFGGHCNTNTAVSVIQNWHGRLDKRRLVTGHPSHSKLYTILTNLYDFLARNTLRGVVLLIKKSPTKSAYYGVILTVFFLLQNYI